MVKMVNMINKTVTATKAKTAFAELIDTARKEPVTITRNNRPVAVVLSPEEYEHLVALDDAYWVRAAAKSEAEGSLSVEESERFINSILNEKA